ncbi:MAG: rod shape-determining protein MreC [Minisyncoccia bacterium]
MIKNKNIFKLLTKVIILITFVSIFKIYQRQEFFLKTKAVETLEPINTPIFLLSSLESWISDLFHFSQIRNEYLKLKQENISLRQQISYLNSLKEENETLRQALKIKEEKNWHLIPAKVILIDPSGLSGNLWINKGTEDGLKNGMNVITAEGVLVGRIIQCLGHRSLVESIFSPGVKISVYDQRSKVLAVAEKDFKGNFYLKLVPPMADIEIGDTLLTSGENTFYLKGLLVAKVKDKFDGSKTPEKNYLLEPFLNRLQIQDVLIITDFSL